MENSTQQVKKLAQENSHVLPEISYGLNISQDRLNLYIEQLKLAQNLPLGLAAGLLAAVLGAVLWALITISIEYQIGYMAVAVGLMVGFAIKLAGKGIDKVFGMLGAVLSLFGCLLGNLLSIVGFVADAEGLGYLETMFMFNYGMLPQIMAESFSPIDLLFYGIAIYQGYKFSFRQLTEQEILANAAEPAVAAGV